MSVRRIPLLVWVFLAAAAFTSTVSAQTDTPISRLTVAHQFGQSIIFSAEIESDVQVQSANLTFRPGNASASTVIPASIQPNGHLQAEYTLKPQDRIPAFTTIEYWFTIELTGGSRLESDKEEFQYTDNRFDWQTLDLGDNYFVYWQEGDLAFGQSILDIVASARTGLDQYIDLPFPPNFDLYIYPTNDDLNRALGLTDRNWVSGHAIQGGSTILVALPAGFDQQLDARRIIPHEITHLRLEQYMQEEIGSLPMWYAEGLASLAEEFTPPEYWELLQSAHATGEIFPLEQLCESFPAETGTAGLAYAQSESFVRYLHDRFGKIGLQAVLNAYLAGQSCSAGVESALGVPMTELESVWYRATFNNALVPRSFTAALPWIALLLVILAAPLAVVLVNLRRSDRGTV
jgi:hypothetical protein